ncbi:MAG: DUF364 domain-containing protein [Candidatus Wallbacteria bacterium]|nr:DUF364 domain-containing protein [Candidatus Wallbacteria bacterium]
MDSKLRDALLSRIDPKIKLKEFYTFVNAVLAKSKRLGMAIMITGMPGLDDDSQTHHRCYLKELVGRKVRDVAVEMLESRNCLKASLGMACISSALPLPDLYFEGDAIDAFEKLAASHKTAFIGHFPLAERWRDQGLPVDIVELSPGPGDILWSDSHQLLSKTELLFLTGLTLVNGTFEEVIRRTPNAKYRILLGPTVPFSDVFFDFGIDLVGSVLLPDERQVLDYYQHGGGGLPGAPAGTFQTVCLTRTPQLQKFLKKI